MPSAHNVTISRCVICCAVVAANSGRNWFTWQDVRNFKGKLMLECAKVDRAVMETSNWDNYYKLDGYRYFKVSNDLSDDRIEFNSPEAIRRMFNDLIHDCQNDYDLNPRIHKFYSHLVENFTLEP